MADIAKIKKRLKEWESTFFTVHQRKPDKEDIHHAPDNIKALYRTYHAAKRSSQGTAALQESNQQEVEEKVESTTTRPSPCQERELSQASVWGPEFNKKPAGSSAPSSSTGCSTKKEGSSLLNKLGDKLFAKCSTTPILAQKKKPSFTSKVKSPETSPGMGEGSAASPQSSSFVQGRQSSSFTASDDDEFRLKGEMFEKAIRLSTGKRPSSMGEGDVSRKFLVPGRLGRRFSMHGNQDQDNTLDQGFEGSSQTSDKVFLRTGSLSGRPPVAGKFCVDSEAERQLHSCGHTTLSDKWLGDRNILPPPETGKNFGGVLRPSSSSSRHENRSGDTSPSQVVDTQSTAMDSLSTSFADEGCSKQMPKTRGKKMAAKGRKSRPSRYPVVSSEEGAGPSTSIASLSDEEGHSWSGHNIASMKTAPSSWPPHTEKEGSSDCEGGENRGKKRKQKASAPKRKRQFPREEDCADVVDGDEMDSSVQQPVSPVKPTKRKKVSGPTTVSAARKTENFVRLNMKAKKFVRKRPGMTGGQWKRKQWKQKMAARSKSYGDKCFKCGQSGHWANKCPDNQGGSHSSIGGDITPVDEHAFPSLRSAAVMAQGGKTEGLMNRDFEGDEELAVEAMVVRERYEPEVRRTPVVPFTQLVTDEEEEIQQGLRVFGFSSFRQGQKETVTRILNGESTLVILSTGGGKSLCYQLPAYLYAQHTRGIALVVSPLVSLMEDQVTGLPPGVRGACLNSNMTPGQRDGVLADVNAGKVHFLLVSPEAVVGGGGRGLGSFPSVDKLPPIFFACIDEVHCLSEWSHNFRPSYLRLCKVLREKYGVRCFLGLTATATRGTAADVGRHLGMADLEAATIRASPVPPNLCLSASRDDKREEALVNLLQGKRFSSCSSVIIYCTRREQVERVATLIRTCLPSTDVRPRSKGKPGKAPSASCQAQWTVESYHAGLTPAQRKRVQKGFMEGRIRVVVATVAFGMGLDKADVRAIIHYNMPKSFENYVQEIGRAGRDGELSHCHLFLDPQVRN